MSKIQVFTDGASRGNPGSAGWGAVIAQSSSVVELGGAITEGTNNQAELMAVVSSLEYLSKAKEAEEVHIYSDSNYTISGATGWINGWKARGWETKTGDAIKNKGLWQKYDHLQNIIGFKINFHKVKGHASIPGNERADEIATAFADGEDIDLYDGNRDEYAVSLNPEPQYLDQQPLYFSLVDGVAYRHTSWEDCQDRVSGVSAEYRKVRTVAERDKLLAEWGVSLDQVKG